MHVENLFGRLRIGADLLNERIDARKFLLWANKIHKLDGRQLVVHVHLYIDEMCFDAWFTALERRAHPNVGDGLVSRASNGDNACIDPKSWQHDAWVDLDVGRGETNRAPAPITGDDRPVVRMPTPEQVIGLHDGAVFECLPNRTCTRCAVGGIVAWAHIQLIAEGVPDVTKPIMITLTVPT